MQQKIIFLNADRKLKWKQKNGMKDWLYFLFENEKKLIKKISYVFCSDEYLLHLNEQFLQHFFYTDILTFNLSNPSSKKIEGEIYISIDRVKENALGYNTTPQEELFRVISHGALHLCGLDDQTEKEKSFMRKKEDFYVEQLAHFVPRETTLVQFAD